MLAALLCLTLQPTEDQIFDGKTLAGWEVVGGGTWTVADGVLKGACKQADDQGLLVYKHPVTNFWATFEYRIASGNSGFYFRTERIKEQPLVKGFQAEVDAIDDVGGIWETAGRGWVFKPTLEIHAKAKVKVGEWNTMAVQAIGDHYVIKINGQTITDIRDAEARKTGHVALQLHGGMDMTVEFRELRLKRLP